ncbi:MAG: hypothetical protein ACRERE_29815 [Candidatus Entotheonellia bacterium]
MAGCRYEDVKQARQSRSHVIGATVDAGMEWPERCPWAALGAKGLKLTGLIAAVCEVRRRSRMHIACASTLEVAQEKKRRETMTSAPGGCDRNQTQDGWRCAGG